MRAVLQRVHEASVKVDGHIVAKISRGWLVLLGIAAVDHESDQDYLIDKILHSRLFADSEGKMNLSIEDIQGEVLVVSQFTLYGDCRKGRRPGFTEAAPADTAKEIYQKFMSTIRQQSALSILEGVFQAHMDVSLINDGPVTLLLDSKKGF